MTLFESWSALGRVALNAVFIFVVLIAMLRLSGKRATAKVNNFDWLVTVAMGALMAQAVLSENVTLAQSIVAIAALLAMQHAATWLASRFAFARNVLLSQPTLLYYDGAFVDDAMHRERVTRREVRAAMRASGCADAGEVAAVVLEPDGTLNTLRRSALKQDARGDDLLEEARHASDPLSRF